MGMVTSIYDVAALIFVGPVSYFGAKNKSRWIGFGMLTMGLGFLIFMLPHFIIEKYHPVTGLASPVNSTSLSSVLCRSHSGVSTSKCVSSSNGSNLYYGLFLLAMFLAGAGCTPMIALGIPFLDDSVHPRKSPMYVGAFSASGVVAALIGFVMAYFCLQVFVNPEAAVSLTPKDREWIGAWWLGFGIGLVLAIIVGIGLLAFPNELENSVKVRKQLEKETAADDKREELPSLTLKEMPKALKELFIDNPTFVFLVIFTSLEFFQISAGTAFLPKMTAVQFRISPAKVSLLYGLIVVPAAALGHLFGSYIQKRFDLGCLGALKFTTIISFTSMLLGLYLFIYCDTNAVAGVNIHNINSSQTLLSQCNQNCSCTRGLFLPVCANGLTYATPCFAGCNIRLGAKINTITNDPLSCFGGLVLHTLVRTDNVTDPYCTPFTILMMCLLCTDPYGTAGSVLMVCLSILQTLHHPTHFFVGAIGLTLLWCVPFRLKSFAVGIQSFMMRVLGSIPGPIIVGYLIDKNCLFWEQTCDKTRGSCRLYENKTMATTVTLSFTISKALGTLSLFAAWQIYKRKSRNQLRSVELKQRLTITDGDESRDTLAKETNSMPNYRTSFI